MSTVLDYNEAFFGAQLQLMDWILICSLVFIGFVTWQPGFFGPSSVIFRRPFATLVIRSKFMNCLMRNKKIYGY